MNPSIRTVYDQYLSAFPSERSSLPLLSTQIEAEEDLISRQNYHGHVTVGGFVIGPDGRVITVYHNILEKYFQPGGHTELSDPSLLDGAIREVREETGLREIQIHPWTREHQIPILIDTHAIPANPRKGEAAHYHHEFLWLLQTPETEIDLQLDEVSDHRWMTMDELSELGTLMSRAVEKMRDMELVV